MMAMFSNQNDNQQQHFQKLILFQTILSQQTDDHLNVKLNRNFCTDDNSGNDNDVAY